MAALALSALTALAQPTAEVAESAGARRQCLQAPVAAEIVRRFDAPACPYCSGHRTLDYSAVAGAAVRAPIAGTVTFAGTVAGVRYITITALSDMLSPGVLVTVGGVHTTTQSSADTHVETSAAPGIAAGDVVEAGQIIGRAAQDPIRLSLRRITVGGPAEYLDPEPSLVRWRAPIRLVLEPDQGGTSRRVTPRWSCRRAV